MAECGRSYRGGVLSLLVVQATVLLCYPAASCSAAGTASSSSSTRTAITATARAATQHPRGRTTFAFAPPSSLSFRRAQTIARASRSTSLSLLRRPQSTVGTHHAASTRAVNLLGRLRINRLTTSKVPPTTATLKDGRAAEDSGDVGGGGGGGIGLLSRATSALFRRAAGSARGTSAHPAAGAGSVAMAEKEITIPRRRRSSTSRASTMGQQAGGGGVQMGADGTSLKRDWRRGGGSAEWRNKGPRAAALATAGTEVEAPKLGKALSTTIEDEGPALVEQGIGVLDGGAVEKAPRQGLRLGADLREDFARRAKTYKSDWTDGYNRKSLPAILFLYFACLLPAVAFGGIATQVTQGALGVIEYVVSCGLGGMAYALFSGQPMTFIGPTGLTLAFMTALYSFTSVAGLPFLPVYSWVGLWTSGMLITLSLVGASNLIEYATQFTDDVFNALLSVNFIFEACRSLQRNFSPAIAGYSQAGALMSLNVAVATYVGCRKTSAARESRLFTSGIREFVADFGPILVITGMSVFCAMPSWKGLLSFLEVPSKFMLCNGRSWMVPLMSVTPKVRMACALPAMLLTSLFFLDQNISARVVNSPRHKMVKGAAYHQDMAVLGLITGALSLVGLPWQCAATVQSLNHVRQMATLKPSTASSATSKEEIESVHETRATGFCVHALVLGSLALLPQLGKIPMAVVSGIFLYLGRKVMSGNGFLIRVKELLADKALLPNESDFKKVGFKASLRYTLVQAGMLALLWTLKSFKQTALFFPSVIGLLIVVRLLALPKMFSPKELSKLDAAVG